MNHEELVLLIGRYLDGQLDDAACQTFNQLLRNDANAATFVAHARLHANLFQINAAGLADHVSRPASTTFRKPARRGVSARRRIPRRRLQPRRWRTPLLLVAAMGALLLAILPLLRQQARPAGAEPAPLRHSATVTALQGAASLDGQALRVGGIVPEGGLVLSRDGSIALALADGSQILLGAETRLRVDRLWPARLLRLEHGDLAVHAVAHTPPATLEVRIPQGTVSVVGTRFRLFASRHRSTLQVESGRVRFTGQGLDRVLDAGEDLVIGDEAADDRHQADPVGLAFAGFTLYDIDRDRAVPGFDPIADGAVIDRAALALGNYTITVAIRGEDQLDFIRFSVNGRPPVIERNPPYAVTENILSEDGKTMGYKPLRLDPGERLIRGVAVSHAGQEVHAELRIVIR